MNLFFDANIFTLWGRAIWCVDMLAWGNPARTQQEPNNLHQIATKNDYGAAA
jgi:hypothetical protein